MGQDSQASDPPKFSISELTEMGQEYRERGEVVQEVKGGEQRGKMSSGLEVLSLKKREDILMQLTGKKLEVCSCWRRAQNK